MRYLPVPSFWWYPEPFADGPRMVVVPADTPVHVTRSGRVTHVDDQAVGTVVVRDDHECFHHYRRLRASSISVEDGALVDAGDVIGVVAHPNDGSTPALLYGVHDAADTWIDIVELLAGARDPVVLDQRLPIPAAAPASSADRSPPTRPHSTPTVPTDRATASSLAGRPPAAAERAQPHDDESIEHPVETPTTASESSPTTTPDEPPASPPAASDEPTAPPPAHEPDTSRRSRLAARRPPRRSS